MGRRVGYMLYYTEIYVDELIATIKHKGGLACLDTKSV